MGKTFLIFILVLFAISAFGQTKTIKWDNQQIINYFTRNMGIIKKVDGIEFIVIPTEQTINKNEKLVFIEGYPVQYKIKTNKDIEIIKIKTKAKVFNFNTKKITTVDLDVDGDVFERPKDLKNKIKKEAKL